MFEKIAKWYKQRLWSAKMVDNAVAKSIITKAQAAKIKKEAQA